MASNFRSNQINQLPACLTYSVMQLSNNSIFIPGRKYVYIHVVEQKHCDSMSLPNDWIPGKSFSLPFVRQTNVNGFYCVICDKIIRGLASLESHMEEAYHIDGVDRNIDCLLPLRNGLYHCKICNCIISNNKKVQSHLFGDRHNAALRCLKQNSLLELEIKIAEPIEWSLKEYCVKPFVSRERENEFYCMLCNCCITGHEMVQIHVYTLAHTDELEKHGSFVKPLNNPFYHCNLCDTYIVNHKLINKHLRNEKHLSLLAFEELGTERREKNMQVDANLVHSAKQDGSRDNSNRPVGINEVFSMINEELVLLYEQLRPNESRQIERDPDEAIARWLKIFSRKSPSDETASTRLEYLAGLMELLYEDLKEDANARVKTGNCFSVTKWQLNMKILSFLEHRTNRAKESRDSIDSGNEDISQLTSTSSIHTENIDNKQRRKKMYREKVVDLLNFNKDIYDMSEKTRKMLLGMNLRFVINSSSDYCLICRKIVPNSLDKCLEHLCNREHTKHLENIEKNHLLFPFMYDSFSELSLAHEYIEILSEDATRCLVCSKEMGNDDSVLVQHFDDQYHRDMWEKMRSRAKKNIDLVASHVHCDWYNVQKYECVPCLKTFDFEIDFVEHLLENEKHTNNVEKMQNNGEPRMIYDYCSSCALLWCICPSAQSNHRESLTHKWFVKNGPLLNTEFPESARELLHSCESGNFDILDIVEEIEKDCRSSIERAYEKGTGHDCNLSLSSQAPVEDIKFIKLFNKICPSSVGMISFLKEWITKCDLAGIQQISSVALYWYVILYLQTVSVLPSVASLNTMKMFWHELADWEDLAKLKQQSFHLKQHIIGFFTLYANFDYRYDVACPLLGRVMEKKSFADDTYCLPEEMRSYVTYMSNTKYPEPFKMDSVMCLQDPFDLQSNLTQYVKKVDLSRFRSFCFHSLSILCTSEV